MGSIYSETMELRSPGCDMHGAWKPGAILETMQETAGVHSTLFGLGRDEMGRLGLGWVISRLKVEFDRVPQVGERVIVETYPTPNRHLFFPRSHIFRDAQGGRLGAAHTLWLVMDLETRRMVKSEEVLAKIPENADMKPAAGMPGTVRPLDGEVKSSVIVPQFTDLDSNGHVNNTKYLDWCLNALGMEIMREKCVTGFEANYDAELRLGDELRTELTMQGDSFTFCGLSGDRRRFSIGGRLGNRQRVK